MRFGFPGGLLAFLGFAALAGLLVGAAGRLLLGPGRQYLGPLPSMAAGVGGAVLAGLVGALLVPVSYVPALVLSVAGAAALIWAFEADRRVDPRGGRVRADRARADRPRAISDRT